MSAPSLELQTLKAEFFRALAHPARIRLLELLSERGEQSVQSLQARLDLDQPIVSQQLARLRASGIVVSRKEGTTVHYALANPKIADLLAVAKAILSHRLDQPPNAAPRVATRKLESRGQGCRDQSLWQNVPTIAMADGTSHRRPLYRPDIDGLRALAVLAVIGFHASPRFVPGGFVGVDVFFVVSGFLISGIIFDQLGAGTFSFRDFYARRIRRIFPALAVVLVACWVFGWFVLVADEYMQLMKHIGGAATFVSNFVLWREAGYFDAPSDAKPLLHLWSLGIEEQFYLLWPPILVLCWKRGLNHAVGHRAPAGRFRSR